MLFITGNGEDKGYCAKMSHDGFAPGILYKGKEVNERQKGEDITNRCQEAQ